MKDLLALVAIFNALATALASLDIRNTSYAAASGSSSADNVLPLPPQPAGESLTTFLERLFPSDITGNSSTNTTSTRGKNKRGTTLVTPVITGPYTESYGLHQSVWDEDMDSGSVTYNFSADFSDCGTGIKFGTNVGIYTFTNGTTNNDTDFRDMVADLWSLRHSRTSPNRNYANHTAVQAKLALDEGTQLLKSLICHNNTNTALAPVPDRNELRHLLANKHSYWTAVILSAAGGASIGAIVAAVADLVFKGHIVAENVVQTAIVIGAVVLIGGILTRCDQVGRLDRAEVLAHRAAEIVPQGREAVVQNVYIAWARRQLARIARRQVEEALSEAGVTSAGGSTPHSLPSGPGSPGSPGSACLSELEAGEAAGAIEMMSNVNLNLERIQEVVEQLGPRDEGGCSSP